MSDAGVWVKLESASAAGAAVVSSHSGGSLESGVTIDGKTYDIYTFTEVTTVASVKLSDDALKRIDDPEVIAAVEASDSAEDLIAEYGDVLKDSLVVVPAVDPGLSMTFSDPGLVDIIIVGGGAGTFPNSGGGGAGGVLTVIGAYAPEGMANITVAQGGSGTTAAAGGTGYSSHFGPYYVPGGGAPIDRKNPESQGGSGAGGSYGTFQGTFGVPGLGNDGGTGAASGACGGGGGANAPGGNASGSAGSASGGPGGDGIDISAFIGQSPGTTVVGGGGGGWGGGSIGLGGAGGGGGGGTGGGAAGNSPALPGEANTGGGAGADGWQARGQEGGSGIVIVRVEVA